MKKFIESFKDYIYGIYIEFIVFNVGLNFGELQITILGLDLWVNCDTKLFRFVLFYLMLGKPLPSKNENDIERLIVLGLSIKHLRRVNKWWQRVLNLAWRLRS